MFCFFKWSSFPSTLFKDEHAVDVPKSVYVNRQGLFTKTFTKNRVAFFFGRSTGAGYALEDWFNSANEDFLNSLNKRRGRESFAPRSIRWNRFPGGVQIWTKFFLVSETLYNFLTRRMLGGCFEMIWKFSLFNSQSLFNFLFSLVALVSAGVQFSRCFLGISSSVHFLRIAWTA